MTWGCNMWRSVYFLWLLLVLLEFWSLGIWSQCLYYNPLASPPPPEHLLFTKYVISSLPYCFTVITFKKSAKNLIALHLNVDLFLYWHRLNSNKRELYILVRLTPSLTAINIFFFGGGGIWETKWMVWGRDYLKSDQECQIPVSSVLCQYALTWFWKGMRKQYIRISVQCVY